MSSVIKVDQIQLANGSTPTAADLGLNTTGNIINTYQFDVLDVVSNSNGNYVTASTGIVTPTSASSKFLLCPSMHLRLGGGAATRSMMGVRILRNGTVINNTVGTVETLHFNIASGSINELDAPYSRQHIDHPNTTSSVQYDVQIALGPLGVAAYAFPSSFGSNFIILEIAG